MINLYIDKVTSDGDKKLRVELQSIQHYKDDISAKIEALSPCCVGNNQYSQGYEKARDEALVIVKSEFVKLFNADHEKEFREANECIINFVNDLMPDNKVRGDRYLQHLKENITNKLGDFMWRSYMMGRNEGKYISEEEIAKLKKENESLSNECNYNSSRYREAYNELNDLKGTLRLLTKTT
jgi:hypothetical protein